MYSTKIDAAARRDPMVIKRHLAWMCNEVHSLVDGGRLEKANRWLGFVQGCLWLMGIKTLDELRDDVRPTAEEHVDATEELGTISVRTKIHDKDVQIMLPARVHIPTAVEQLDRVVNTLIARGARLSSHVEGRHIHVTLADATSTFIHTVVAEIVVCLAKPPHRWL
jgi:hypothetical protein